MKNTPIRRYKVTDSLAQEWWRRLTDSEDRIHRDHFPRWSETLLDYIGKTPLEKMGQPDRDGSEFNFLLSTVNTVIPAIAGSDRYIRVKARREEEVEKCRNGESALNFIAPKMDVSEVGQEALLDEELFGIGIVGVEIPSRTAGPDPTYDTGPEQDPREDAPLTPEEEVIEEIFSMLLEEPPSDDVSADDVQLMLPTLRRIPPASFLVPAGYNRIKRMPWVCHRRPALLEDLKGERLPSGRRRFDIADTVTANRTMAGDSMREETQPLGTKNDAVTIYEIRYWASATNGVKTRRLMILMDAGGVSKNAESVIFHCDDPSEMRGYPYSIMRVAMEPGEFYPSSTAPIGSVRTIAHSLNEVLKSTFRHFDAASKQKYVTVPGGLQGDSKLAELLADASDLAVCELPGNVSDIRAALQLVPIAPMPQDVPFVIQTLQRMLYEISGVDIYMRGGVGRKGTTATEVTIASEGTQDRAAFRARKYDLFLADIASKALQLCKQFWDSAVLIRISDQSGDPKFISISSVDLPDEFDIEIDSGTTSLSGPQAAQQSLLGLTNTLNAIATGLQPLEAAGTLPPGSVARFVDKAFAIFNENHILLAGPIGELSAALAGAASPQAATQPVEGQGPAAIGLPTPSQPMTTNPSLAGTGPRPRPGQIAELPTA